MVDPASGPEEQLRALLAAVPEEPSIDAAHIRRRAHQRSRRRWGVAALLSVLMVLLVSFAWQAAERRNTQTPAVPLAIPSSPSVATQHMPPVSTPVPTGASTPTPDPWARGSASAPKPAQSALETSSAQSSASTSFDPDGVVTAAQAESWLRSATGTDAVSAVITSEISTHARASATQSDIFVLWQRAYPEHSPFACTGDLARRCSQREGLLLYLRTLPDGRTVLVADRLTEARLRIAVASEVDDQTTDPTTLPQVAELVRLSDELTRLAAEGPYLAPTPEARGTAASSQDEVPPVQEDITAPLR